MKMRKSQEGEEEKCKSKWKEEHEEQRASETFCDGGGWSALPPKKNVLKTTVCSVKEYTSQCKKYGTAVIKWMEEIESDVWMQKKIKKENYIALQFIVKFNFPHFY
jgi:hypothetical protein